MDQQHDISSFTVPTRHDGWTPADKVRFLSFLAEKGNVRVAAARVGRSAPSAYVQRRRDAAFARSWAAALVLAREHAEQIFADRALEGVEEPVFYRGEQVGTRRRYDNRLLLAHMARLDRLARDEDAERDAARFDEVLALMAGERFDAEAGDANVEGDADVDIYGDDELPPDREDYCDQAARSARAERGKALPYAPGKAAQAERSRELDAAGDAAWAEAAIRWDLWFDRACGVVDRLAGTGAHDAPDRFGRTALRSATSSTSPLGQPATPEGGWFLSANG